MGLDMIKGSYDAIFSLGDLCLTSIQLKKNHLRPYSGVLDWMASPNLSNVNALLRNRFSHFMELENLRVIGYATDKLICVADDANNIVSNHDFSTDKNTLTDLYGYQEVMEKYNRRINRFLHATAHANRILFVRTEGSFEDAIELEDALKSLITHDFRVLLINHTNVHTVVEKDWPLEKVCSVELPAEDKWNANDQYWKYILDGVNLNQ